MDLTGAIYDRLRSDAVLAGLVSSYEGKAAVFTTDPPPGDASLPYVISAGHVSDLSFDTKTTRGREVWRDFRCYAPANGSALIVEAMAERVRALFHRYRLPVTGFENAWVAEARGPIAVDEDEAYGRIVTVRFLLEEV